MPQRENHKLEKSTWIMSLCGQLGVYGQASSKLSKSWFQPQERSNDLLRRLNSPSSVTQPPSALFPPTTPLFPWTCYSGGFFKMYSLLIWIKSLVFGMYSLLIWIWPLVIALVTLSRHRPLFNNAYSTFVYSQVQSLLMVIGHRSTTIGHWEVKSPSYYVWDVQVFAFFVFEDGTLQFLYQGL